MSFMCILLLNIQVRFGRVIFAIVYDVFINNDYLIFFLNEQNGIID